MLRLALAALKTTLTFLVFSSLFLSFPCPLHKYCRLKDGHRKNSEPIVVESENKNKYDTKVRTIIIIILCRIFK